MTKKTVDRSSKNGRFVTHGFAKKHPATTETQRVPARTGRAKPKGR